MARLRTAVERRGWDPASANFFEVPRIMLDAGATGREDGPGGIRYKWDDRTNGQS